MFPVQDDTPTDRLPLVTLALIAASVLALALTGGPILQIVLVVLFLWFFAPAVEAAFGRGQFLSFVVSGGVLAFAAQLADDSTPRIALACATGLVAAMIGAHLRLNPRSRVMSLVTIPFFFTIVAVPIVILAAAWIALQVLVGVALNWDDVPVFAQVACCIFGVLFAPLLARAARQSAPAS